MTEGLDRLIILINDMTIQGNTRLQKYGFVVYQRYAKKNKLEGLNFYSDWKPYLYGPYSQQLKNDLEEAIASNLIAKYTTITPSNREFSNYSLTVKGRMRLRKLLEKYGRVVKELYEKFTQLNKQPMQIILKDIYLAYPEFTVNSEIRDEVMND